MPTRTQTGLKLNVSANKNGVQKPTIYTHILCNFLRPKLRPLLVGNGTHTSWPGPSLGQLFTCTKFVFHI